MTEQEVTIDLSGHIDDQKTVIDSCCGDSITNNNSTDNNGSETIETEKDTDENDGSSKRKIRKGTKMSCMDQNISYAANKNVAEGLMDIALLSANANQLRFLITYNHEASTYFISLGLVILSLTLQVVVGIALIFKRRIKRSDKRYTRANEFIIGGVFIVTVVNILLAAFTTTDVNKN